MSKLQKVGIILSAIWAMVVMGVVSMTAMNSPIEFFGMTLMVAGVPLAILWGVWWIIKK